MSMSAVEEELESGGVSLEGSEGSESIDEGPSSCPPAPRVSAFSALMNMDSDAHSSEGSDSEGEESEDVEEDTGHSADGLPIWELNQISEGCRFTGNATSSSW